MSRLSPSIKAGLGGRRSTRKLPYPLVSRWKVVGRGTPPPPFPHLPRFSPPPPPPSSPKIKQRLDYVRYFVSLRALDISFVVWWCVEQRCDSCRWSRSVNSKGHWSTKMMGLMKIWFGGLLCTEPFGCEVTYRVIKVHIGFYLQSQELSCQHSVNKRT